jgi:hypothetical protein
MRRHPPGACRPPNGGSTFQELRPQLPVAVCLLLMGSVVAPEAAGGEVPPARSDEGVPSSPTLRLISLVPEFLTLYREAEEKESRARALALEEGRPLDPDTVAQLRRAIWEREMEPWSHRLARAGSDRWEPDGLESAWARYGRVVNGIRSAEDRVFSEAEDALRDASQVLRLDRPLEVELILYVGTFDEAPAFRLRSGNYTLLIPAEDLPTDLRPLFLDLFTRALHARLAGRPPEGRLSLAQHLFLRGLALRVHEEVDPGQAAESYLLRSRSWLLSVEQRDGAITAGMRERLEESDSERIEWIRRGSGISGHEGEFDFMAWRLSGLLLMDGWTLDRLARVPESEVAALVDEALTGRP